MSLLSTHKGAAANNLKPEAIPTPIIPAISTVLNQVYVGFIIIGIVTVPPFDVTMIFALLPGCVALAVTVVLLSLNFATFICNQDSELLTVPNRCPLELLKILNVFTYFSFGIASTFTFPKFSVVSLTFNSGAGGASVSKLCKNFSIPISLSDSVEIMFLALLAISALPIAPNQFAKSP